MWHVMVASEHLLECAIARSSGELADYFRAHLEEERHHADWLAEDLRSVGVEASRTKIPREAMEMVGSVYYLIFHAHPAALLGYMSVLEGVPLKANLERWSREYPSELLRTIRHHAEADPGHFEELRQVIARLTEDERRLVGQTRQVTFDYLRRSAAYFAGDTNGREQSRTAAASAAA
jgi:rubrerythrin